ncbi:MAG: hypothetical protein GY696_23930 [Gammaproteobacteria bacterium]|nr:hypothetical protein [Gammaproteobacteria bacterium]
MAPETSESDLSLLMVQLLVLLVAPPLHDALHVLLPLNIPLDFRMATMASSSSYSSDMLKGMAIGNGANFLVDSGFLGCR